MSLPLPLRVRATGGVTTVATLSPTVQAALLILHAVDVAGGQGAASDQAFLWEAPLEHRPLIAWSDIRRLRAAVADEIDAHARADNGLRAGRVTP